MTTGDDFTAYEIINTYKTLLYASDAAVSTIPNEGITNTLKTIRSADGSFSPLQLSSSFVNINGPSTLKLNGTTLTATATELNTLVSSSGTLKNIRVTATSGLIGSQAGVVVSVINTSATLIVNPSLSVTNFIANTGSFTTKVSGVAAEFSGDVSANNVFAATNIFIGGAAIPDASFRTSINSVITSINSVITSINTVVAAVSALTSVNKVAITSINSIIGDGTGFATVAALASVSAVMATSIGNSNTNITTNISAITSINTVVAAVSALTSVNKVAITSINTVVAAVSALTSVNKAAITSINSAITSINAGTFNTLTVTTSASIGGTLAIGTSAIKTLTINGPALSVVVSLTDATSITSDFDVGQNFALTLADNRTLAAPTNLDSGQVGSIFITQDGTGSRTLAFNTVWKFPGGTVPTLSTTAGAVDRIDYIVFSGTAVQAIATLNIS
tara:strand:+ start:7318 stop:8664 length:1347 start_codon:yes stop_codon:yes gene_type:complete